MKTNSKSKIIENKATQIGIDEARRHVGWFDKIIERPFLLNRQVLGLPFLFASMRGELSTSEADEGQRWRRATEQISVTSSSLTNA